MNPEWIIWLSIACIIAGVFFVLVGTLGVLRFPDFYTRIHAAGIVDTLGLELILVGLMLQEGLTQTTLKLALIGFILFITSPTSTHALANAAYHDGLKPLLGKLRNSKTDGSS